jgi:hypothetical protein
MSLDRDAIGFGDSNQVRMATKRHKETQKSYNPVFSSFCVFSCLFVAITP